IHISADFDSLRQYAGTYYRLLFQIVFAFMGSVSSIPIAFAALCWRIYVQSAIDENSCHDGTHTNNG
ncbi:MAG TPA: hypothetical protein VER14_01355, partial [Phototrophicaceae bacterium]|nr:hypothetical protein [Phototrophicaceae bacterium]